MSQYAGGFKPDLKSREQILVLNNLNSSSNNNSFRALAESKLKTYTKTPNTLELAKLSDPKTKINSQSYNLAEAHLK